MPRTRTLATTLIPTAPDVRLEQVTIRLPTVVAPYARRTSRLAEVLRLLAFAFGEPGARLVA